MTLNATTRHDTSSLHDLSVMTAGRIVRGVVAYVSFFWAVSWRSVALAILMAVGLGVGLGVATNIGWLQEDAMTPLANIIAAPMTLSVVIGVIVIQTRARLI